MLAIESASFFTFGMFIIDEVEFTDGSQRDNKIDLIGGAGTYAVLGARLASSPDRLLSRSISWIVDMGSDFPQQIRNTIESWNTDCNLRHNTSRLTTRAWNGYGAEELRSFEYRTPKIRLEVDDLSQSQVLSKSFHMICSSDRLLNIVEKLRLRRTSIDSEAGSPLIVWEPIPDLCNPGQLSRLQMASQLGVIISPNHAELRSFFPPDSLGCIEQVELVKNMMQWTDEVSHCQPTTIPIIREGANGSTAYLRHPTIKRICSIHVPAFHTADMAGSVIDPTGGGNTYLGALALALTDVLWEQPTFKLISKAIGIKGLPKDLTSCLQAVENKEDFRSPHLASQTTIAMIYATIAASFVIEQYGVPNLQQTETPCESIEYWNGEKFIDRLGIYLKREGHSVTTQLKVSNRIMNESFTET